MKRRAAIWIVGIIVIGFSLGAPTLASDWPERPVSLVVGAGPGGGQDAAARLYGKYLQKYLGKPFPVVNMAGGSNTIALEHVRTAKPDGYTALVIHENMLTIKLTKKAEYSYEAFEFGGLALVSKSVGLFANSEKYQSFDQVIEASKANPASVIVGTEIGLTTHLQLMAIEKQLGIKLQIVDGGSVGARIGALLGGHMDLTIMPLGNCKDYVKTGDFIPLVMLNNDRVEAFKQYPIMSDYGFNVPSVKFFGLFFPKDTSQEILSTFRTALKKIAADPDFIKEAASLDCIVEYHDSTDYLDQAYTVMENY